MPIRLTAVDESTGEILITSRSWNNARQPRWIKVFAESLLTLAVDPDLRPGDIRLLAYLICRMDRDNQVACRSRYIAADLRCSHAYVNQAIARLIAKGALTRVGNLTSGVYRIAHKVAWRASSLRWSEVNQQ